MAKQNKRRKRVPRQNWKPHWLMRTLYIAWRAIFSVLKIAAGALATVLLIGVVCGFVFVGILGDYLQDEIIPQAEVNLEDYDLDLTSYVYGVNSDGDIEMIQQIYGAKRQWVAYEDLPQDLIDATVALEDKRFYEHQGVDWITTAKACLNMFFGGSSQFGGSTITQQLIKNLFLPEDDSADDVTVQRKVIEIFRALEFEKRYDKSVVLEYYLNVVYFGRGCNGVKSAAETYFGKELQDLTVAEYASLISITNNPTLYDPYRQTLDNYRGEKLTGVERNRKRQLTCLSEMKTQGWLTEEEYDAAVAQELVFKEGIADEDRWLTCETTEERTGCGYEGPVRDLILENEHYYCPSCGQEIDVKANLSQAVYSYFVDTVLTDVATYLAEQDGLVWSELGKTSRENYFDLIKRRGYHIYTTINLDVQAQVEKIYSDLSQIPETRSGQQLQSAIVVIDNNTGDIVGIAGGVGEKTDFLGQNRATQSNLQIGSSIKPLTVYAPAFEMGIINPATIIPDMPLWYTEKETTDANGDPELNPFPKNDDRKYTYSRTVFRGIIRSMNAIAVNTLDLIGAQYSYNFAKNNFHLSGLVDRYVTSSGTVLSDIGESPLGMGALTKGVTVRDVATAYATFANSGEYRESRTFTKVYDSDGNLVIDNVRESEQILSQKTVDYMNYCLNNAVNSGPGTGAIIDGMEVCGKTGTTANNKDRYFCGFTGYYTAAVWCGYDTPEVINLVGSTVNPAVRLWKKVMEPIHKGLESVSLYNTENMVEVSICMESGKLASSACYADVRGFGRVEDVLVYEEDMPTEFCDCHVSLDYCTEGGGVANDYCHKFESVGALLLEKKALVKMTQATIDSLVKAGKVGLLEQYLTDDYVYLVDNAGNGVPFFGMHNDLDNPLDTPYVSCTIHTQEAWEQYVADNPWLGGDEPEDPTEPTAPEEPTDPTEPTEPTDPTEPEEDDGGWWPW